LIDIGAQGANDGASSASADGSATRASTNAGAHVAPSNNGVPWAPASGGANGTSESINGSTPMAFINGGVPNTPIGDCAPPTSPLPPLPIINAHFVAGLVMNPSLVSVERNEDLTDASIHRPERDWYVQVKDDASWTLGPVATIENRDSRKTYILHPSIKPYVPANQVHDVRLYTAISDKGDVFLWPIKVGAQAKGAWASSAQAGVDAARKGWVKLAWNDALKKYDRFEPMDEMGEPLWPRNITFQMVLEFALRDAVITTLEHPEIRRLGRLSR
jgi:hypothetical protein